MQENVKLVTVKKTVRQAYRTEPIWQYDVGHVLNLEGFDNLPETFQMHYSHSQMGDAITQIGSNGQVSLPDEFAQTSAPIYAWVYVAEDDTGLTKYTIEIPVMRRARITNQEPTPVEQSAIDQAISALNAGVSRAETAAANAESSEDAASASAESAYRSSEAAAGAAESAAGDATAAGRSATAAGESASAAAASAANASGSATTAGNAATAAQAAANTATQKSGEAVSSANSAAASALSAGQSAQTATQKANDATSAATSAHGSASAASGSASAAGQSATAAAGSAAAAAQTKTEIDNEVDGFQAQLTNLSSALNQKQDAPQTPGTAGQVLGLDSNLDPVWQDQSGGDVEADGTYEDLTAGNSLEVLSDRGTADAEPYLFRKAVGWNRAKLNALVGGTVAWNQRIQGGTVNNGIRATKTDDGHYTLSGSATASWANVFGFPTMIAGHWYLIAGRIVKNPNNVPLIINANNNVTSKTSSSEGVYFAAINSTTSGMGVSGLTSGTDYTGVEITFNLFDITQMFGTNIANYFRTLETVSAGSAIALFRSWFPEDYYEYNPGELISVSGVQSRDTVGFNLFDKSTSIIGKYINDTTGSAMNETNSICTDWIRVIPNSAYYIKSDATSGRWGAWYDADKQYVSGINGNGLFTAPSNAFYVRCTVKYGLTSNGNSDTFCINLSDTSRNGTYKPYIRHSYPLDSSLTLRGIPKLVDNQITFDGDQYKPDGTVNRRYGVVDLGTLTWAKYNLTFYANVDGLKPTSSSSTAGNILCSKYVNVALYLVTGAQPVDKAIAANNAQARINLYDSLYAESTASEFKTAMSGVYLVYELGTPTTETAEPYRNLQIQEKGETEEFVSNAALPVPVGHDTFYPVNVFDYIDAAIAAALNS